MAQTFVIKCGLDLKPKELTHVSANHLSELNIWTKFLKKNLKECGKYIAETKHKEKVITVITRSRFAWTDLWTEGTPVVPSSLNTGRGLNIMLSGHYTLPSVKFAIYHVENSKTELVSLNNTQQRSTKQAHLSLHRSLCWSCDLQMTSRGDTVTSFWPLMTSSSGCQGFRHVGWMIFCNWAPGTARALQTIIYRIYDIIIQYYFQLVSVKSWFKDALPLSFDQNCLHLIFNNTSAVKPSKYNYPCMLKYYRKTTLLKQYGPQIWLCLFNPITLKQLNNSTSIGTFSCFSGLA